jgi:hypothetical protein
MPVDETPDDEGLRQSYNFAPGYHGIVYRADAPDFGGSKDTADKDAKPAEGIDVHEAQDDQVKHESDGHDTKYKLQAMKWGMHGFTPGFTHADGAAQVSSRSGRNATQTMARCSRQSIVGTTRLLRTEACGHL